MSFLKNNTLKQILLMLSFLVLLNGCTSVKVAETKNTKSICQGATGKELSRPDAEFLTREAARADKIRLGLDICYKYADEVVKQ